MIAPRYPESSFPDPAAGRPLVDLRLRVETPENIVLTYTLAGPMLRSGAYLIDLALRVLVLGVVYFVLLCSAVVTPNAALGAMLILAFVASWLYFTLFEAFWNGRTPGKFAMGLRVVKDKGYPITFLAAFGRNLARAADALGFYLVGFVVMLLSPRFQRLGDWLAQTVVVRERPVRMPHEPVILERIEPLPREAITGPAPPPRTLALIDEFLGRRHSVSIARGHEIARPLAQAVATRLRFAGQDDYVTGYPMAFLARVYVTFHRRDESNEMSNTIPRRGEPLPASTRQVQFNQSAEAH